MKVWLVFLLSFFNGLSSYAESMSENKALGLGKYLIKKGFVPNDNEDSLFVFGNSIDAAFIVDLRDRFLIKTYREEDGSLVMVESPISAYFVDSEILVASEIECSGREGIPKDLNYIYHFIKFNEASPSISFGAVFCLYREETPSIEDIRGHLSLMSKMNRCADPVQVSYSQSETSLDYEMYLVDKKRTKYIEPLFLKANRDSSNLKMEKCSHLKD